MGWQNRRFFGAWIGRQLLKNFLQAVSSAFVAMARSTIGSWIRFRWKVQMNWHNCHCSRLCSYWIRIYFEEVTYFRHSFKKCHITAWNNSQMGYWKGSYWLKDRARLRLRAKARHGTSQVDLWKIFIKYRRVLGRKDMLTVLTPVRLPRRLTLWTLLRVNLSLAQWKEIGKQ